MNLPLRSQLRLRIIGYFNILVIYLGLTPIRVDFLDQRVIQTRPVAIYVNCANIAVLTLLPVLFIIHPIEEYMYTEYLEAFSDTMVLLVIFGAIAVSVLLRRRRDGIHLEIAESIIELDRSYFNKACGNKSTDRWADCILYFKIFVLFLYVVAPFSSFILDQVVDYDGYIAIDLLEAFYESYMYSIPAASLFMYCYMMWLLHKRFCLLNRKMKELLRQLQQVPVSGEQFEVNISAQRRFVADATEALLRISQIHTDLNRLLVRLNVDYKQQILAGLLLCIVNGVSFGFYLSSSMQQSIEWELDLEEFSMILYTTIQLVDTNLVYWISDMTMASHDKMAQILRRFQILPPLGDEFEQESELFALQLQQRKADIKIAGLLQLNRESSLGLWIFVLNHVIIFMQFDIESRQTEGTKTPLLDRFNRFFRHDV